MSIFACPSSFQTVMKHGSGGGQVVSVFALYSDNPSSNPADAYSFFSTFFFYFDNQNFKFLKVCVKPWNRVFHCPKFLYLFQRDERSKNPPNCTHSRQRKKYSE